MLAQIVAGLLRLFGPTVEEANAAVAAELDTWEACDAPLFEQPWNCPERVRWALVAISDRELPSPGEWTYRWYGRHAVDSRYEVGFWRKGHRRGREGRKTGALHWWCPAHHDAEGMSTVGLHGLVYLFNVHRFGVPGNCVPWWVLGVPTFSAAVARDRYLDQCRPDKADGWCPSVDAVFRSWRRRCDRRMLSREECREGVRAAGS